MDRVARPCWAKNATNRQIDLWVSGRGERLYMLQKARYRRWAEEKDFFVDVAIPLARSPQTSFSSVEKSTAVTRR